MEGSLPNVISYLEAEPGLEPQDSGCALSRPQQLLLLSEQSRGISAEGSENLVSAELLGSPFFCLDNSTLSKSLSSI